MEKALARPAGFWIRVVAFLIDFLGFILVQGVLLSVGRIFSGGGAGALWALWGATHLFAGIIFVAYVIGFHWRWGQTVGKMLMQIRVVNMDGGPLSLGQSIGRYFAVVLSAIILDIGFIMAGLRRDKRALHDLIADTRVERL